MVTPMFLQEKETSTNINSIDTIDYHSVVDVLKYLTFTKFDIMPTVNWVCQHFDNPTSIHLQAMKRILWYLKGT